MNGGRIDSNEANRFTATVIAAIGQPWLAHHILAGLSRLVPFDHLAAIGHRSAQPYSLLSLSRPAHRKYLAGNYRRDPFYRAALRGLGPGLYRLTGLGHAVDPYLREYELGPRVTGQDDDMEADSCSNLSEEIAFVLPSAPGHTLHLAMIRSDRYPRFTDHDLAKLRTVQPIIEAAVARHGELVPWCPPTSDTGSELTARERAVVHELLAGLRSTEIAKLLQISPATIKVHRRNIYRKLQISSLAELFQLATSDPSIAAGPRSARATEST